jgi:hypothetical protein
MSGCKMGSNLNVSTRRTTSSRLLQAEPDALMTRVRGEYDEMPGLRLTLAQACRLWNMEPALCEVVLRTLVREQFLSRTSDGAFIACSNS